MFSSLLLKCIDFLPPPLLRNLLSQRSWRHEKMDDRNLRNSWSCSLQFCPRIRRVCCCGFHTISFLIQAPRKTNDRAGILRACSATVCELYSHLSVFPFSPHAMSLYIDMKMILSLKCSGSHCRSLTRLWIFSRKPNVVILGNVSHSNSVGLPSIQFISLKWLFSEYHLILLFQVGIESSPIFPPHRAQSRRRRRLWRWWSDKPCCTTSFLDIHVKSLNLIVLTPVISVCSPISFQFHWITVPHHSKDDSSRIVNSPQSVFQDELLLEEWHSEMCPE